MHLHPWAVKLWLLLPPKKERVCQQCCILTCSEVPFGKVAANLSVTRYSVFQNTTGIKVIQEWYILAVTQNVGHNVGIHNKAAVFKLSLSMDMHYSIICNNSTNKKSMHLK